MSIESDHTWNFHPFVGTAAGAGCVYFMKNGIRPLIQKALLGFASGVMVAASVWSLLIPAMDMSEHMGKLAFIPAAAGFLLGILFLLILDRTIPHLHMGKDEPEGMCCGFKKTTMLVLAVTLHNIPEGMAVGVVYAGLLADQTGISAAGALALSLGIALQNMPEGAIISMPLKSAGMGTHKPLSAVSCQGLSNPSGCRHRCLDGLYPARAAVSPQFSCRCHVLRRRRRTDSGNVGRRTLGYRRLVLCLGLYGHDGHGRCPVLINRIGRR